MNRMSRRKWKEVRIAADTKRIDGGDEDKQIYFSSLLTSQLQLISHCIVQTITIRCNLNTATLEDVVKVNERIGETKNDPRRDIEV